MTSYRRSPRFSMFNAGIFFAGVGMGGFLCPPSFGVSLLTICSVRLASGPPSGSLRYAASVFAAPYRAFAAPLCCRPVPHARRPSDIEEVLGNSDDVLQV